MQGRHSAFRIHPLQPRIYRAHSGRTETAAGAGSCTVWQRARGHAQGRSQFPASSTCKAPIQIRISPRCIVRLAYRCMQQLFQRVQASATIAAVYAHLCKPHHLRYESSNSSWGFSASTSCLCCLPAVLASISGVTVIWYNCHKLTLVWAVLLCTLHNVATILSDLFTLDHTTSVHGIFLTKHTVNISAGNLYKFPLHTLCFSDCLYCL